MIKKALLASMMVANLVAPSVHAAGAARPLKTVAIELSEKLKIDILGGRKASTLAAPEKIKAIGAILEQLKVDSETKSTLESSLKIGGKNTAAVVDQRVDSLIGLLASKKAAEQAISEGVNVEEATSMKKAAVSMLKTVSNSALRGENQAAKTLNASELKLATEALTKMETIVDQVMKMDKESRDLFAAVEEKRNELLADPKLSPEEALILAIMQVKNCTKEKALQYAERLKNCV